MTEAAPGPGRDQRLLTRLDREVEIERGRFATRFNLVRLGAFGGWLALAAALGAKHSPEWRIQIPILAGGVAVAVALHLVARASSAVRRHFWLAVPLLDIPLVGIAQLRFLGTSVDRPVVAAFAVGILVCLVSVSLLSFDWRAVLGSAGAAMGCAALVLSRAGLGLPDFLASALLIGCGAAVAMFASARARRLVTTLVRSQLERETDLEAQVAARTVELKRAVESLAAAQSDLVRAERMASVATLVRGIAHELNNPIGYLAGNLEPLARYTGFLIEVATRLSDGAPRSADEIRAITRLGKRDLPAVAADLRALTADLDEGARRARLIVGDLQSLTSGAKRAIEAVDLARVVRQTATLLGPRVPDGARLDTAVDALPPLTARAGELEQLMVNLVDNALRAVGPGGAVQVRLERDGARAVVRVSDDGCGMPEEVRQRACEPFFSTRSAGEGSGLGLAIASAIVAGHRGTLTIDSAPGRGTSVTVSLPLDGVPG